MRLRSRHFLFSVLYRQNHGVAQRAAAVAKQLGSGGILSRVNLFIIGKNLFIFIKNYAILNLQKI